MKLVIIGGVAGGASAAARARRLAEDAEIVLFERGPDVSFANCGMPYYLGGKITERDKLLVSSAERLRTRLNIDVRPLSSVERIDRKAKVVQVTELQSGRTYTESYDRLIIATGAAPFRPLIPGADLPGVFTLRSLQDADRIKQYIDHGVQRAVLLGAGFINLELAENFVRSGIATTIVERNNQLLGPFDYEMTTPLLQELRKNGIEVLLGQTAQSIEQLPSALSVKLQSGQALAPAQLVIIGAGVRPDNKLAIDAGLDLGIGGGIRVNDFLQTSDPNIYAVGDVIEVKDYVLGRPTLVPLAGPANRQGRIAADNVFGRAVRYRGTQGTAIIKVFERTAALTGASEKALQATKHAYHKIYIHPTHHASYYPGAEMMSLKVLFDPSTAALLGAQGVGGAGVDKRIDILATAIQAGMTVFDLEEMELSYSPQYGSAKDPINMAGFVAAGLLREDHPQVDVATILSSTTSDKNLLLDVRTAEEFAAGHIPGAVNIPLDDLRSRLNELPRERSITAYCQVGMRGYSATRILLQEGFAANNLGGGYTTYQLFTGK